MRSTLQKINSYLLFFFILLTSNLSYAQISVGCASSTVISEGIFDVTEISDEFDAPDCFPNASADHAVWFKYIPSLTGSININSCVDPNHPNTRLSVLSGTCDDLSCIAYNGFTECYFTSSINLFVNENEPIFLAWDDFYYSDAFQFEIVEIDDIYGCTDPESDNYDSEATVDDGSCFGTCEENLAYISVNGGGPSIDVNLMWEIVDQNNVVYASSGNNSNEIICLADGCYSVNMYSDSIIGWGGAIGSIGTQDTVYYFSLPSGFALNRNFSFGDVDCSDTDFDVYGCTSEDAVNFNMDATIEDNSCVFSDGCDDNFVALNFVGGASHHEISWTIVDLLSGDIVLSGDHEYQTVYECIPDGCYSFLMEDTFGDGWEGSIFSMTNTGNDELILQTTLTDGSSGSQDFAINALDCNLIIPECSDPLAINYDSLATPGNTADCVYIECENNENLVQIVLNNEEQSFGPFFVEGISGLTEYSGELEEAGVHIHSFCLPDGCYDLEFPFDGNYGNLELYVNGEITLFQEYENTNTYPFEVNTDCGLPDVAGCTDPLALNYNPTATIEDNSCEYEVCAALFEVLTVDEENGIIWILNSTSVTNAVSFTWDFGDGSALDNTNFYPDHIYEDFGIYTICLEVSCLNGFEDTFCLDVEFLGLHNLLDGFALNIVSDPSEVVGIESLEINTNNFSLYPNPTSGILTIAYEQRNDANLSFRVYDSMGKLVLEKSVLGVHGLMEIDVEHLPQASYQYEINDADKVLHSGTITKE